MQTRTAPDLRYTDRDVREDPTLKELATRYVSGYGGEFDPLIRAQNMIEMDGELTTAMTRVVLNCMRTDGNVAASLPEPRGYVMSAPPRVWPAVREREREVRSVKLSSEQVTVKGEYLINLHRQARWFHKIDHTRTQGIFYPQNWPGNGANSFRITELRGVCGKDLHPYRIESREVLLGSWEDAISSGNEYCPRCQFGHRDAGWKP